MVRVRPLQKLFEPGILTLTLSGLALWCFLAFYDDRHVPEPLCDRQLYEPSSMIDGPQNSHVRDPSARGALQAP
jgi:hypothetical protein